ncbi:hypothetical protein LEP1GSC170_3266 [Leptospira interrogans serovar Bataviae str. HAI135]|nr:hypothetical protein LEP1GSC170_3266 [Leptospira interrogans serovar Bataviae str. HAI135]
MNSWDVRISIGENCLSITYITSLSLEDITSELSQNILKERKISHFVLL